jgi:hypothetical protein
MANNGKTILAAILMAATCASALGREPAFAEYRAVQESLSRVHPRMRSSWLRERGLDDSPYTTFRKPDSGTGLSCIGRWSYGPSYDVEGRATPAETLVALARGSGVSLIRFARTDSVEIELLADVNAGGIMKRVAVRDSLLYVGSTAGLEIWSITDERNPVRRSWIATALNDFAVQESLAYIIGSDGSFKVYNVADPANPALRGVCLDSGSTIAVTAGTALVGDRWGLYVIDISNPAAPHRVGSWGSAIEGVSARGHLCYVTTFNPNTPGDIGFYILDVSTPSSPRQIGFLDQAGGYDVHLVDTLAYCSGDADVIRLSVVSVADSAHPRLVGFGNSAGWDRGVWASGLSRAAFVATDWAGLRVFDVSVPSSPVTVTEAFAADLAVDVDVDDGRAYVANDMCGLQILDVANPFAPRSLAMYDTAGQGPFMSAALGRDSFAFVGWARPRFRSLDVTDPSRPVLAGTCEFTNPPEDMVLRDSLIYVAASSRFHVVNVARPRAPVLVGSCVLPDESYGLSLQDTLAYVPNWPLEIVSVANPASPRIVGSIWKGSMGVCAVDTLLYVAGGDLFIYNVARSSQPLLVESLYIGDFVSDVVVSDSLAFLACDDGIRLLDVADPTAPRILGLCPTPYAARRVTFDGRHAYAVCWDAGLVIAETTGLGIEETRPPAARTPTALWLEPTVVVREVQVKGPIAEPATASVFDACGRAVLRDIRLSVRPRVDVSSLNSGVYFIEVTSAKGAQVLSFIKP